jgi:predicted kinase
MSSPVPRARRPDHSVQPPAAMPRLIHLNGPPGAGKSTLARRYVDDHPGVLDLEIDTVASLIGGWREDFYAVLAAARSLALAMAEAHLRAGCDVVMPQLETSVDEVARFELTAERAGAAYVEITLGVGPAEQVERFLGKATRTEVDAHIDQVVAGEGGPELLGRVARELGSYLARRPAVIRLDTAGVDGSRSYADLLEILDRR